MEEDQTVMQENTSQSFVPEINKFSISPVMQIFPEFSVPTSGDYASGNQSYGQISSSNLIGLVPLTFQARPPAPLSLNLSLASSNLNEPSSSRHSAFNTIGVA